MSNKIAVIPYETRQGETRVAATPNSVVNLMALGFDVYLETDAGKKAGFNDTAYTDKNIKILPHDSRLYEIADLILQVKRPADNKEKFILQQLHKNACIIGFLDPFLPNSQHIHLYKKQSLTTFALEKIPKKPETELLNPLSAMSKITGKAVVNDYSQYHSLPGQKILILGAGSVGKSAALAAIKHGAIVTIAGKSTKSKEVAQGLGCNYLLLPVNSIKKQQDTLHDHLTKVTTDYSLIIGAAHSRSSVAPILIKTDTLQQLPNHTIIYDLVATSGGNIEGVQIDATVQVGNSTIQHLSGWPKHFPQQSTEAYAGAITNFLQNLFTKTYPIPDLTKSCLASCLTYNGRQIELTNGDLLSNELQMINKITIKKNWDLF